MFQVKEFIHTYQYQKKESHKKKKKEKKKEKRKKEENTTKISYNQASPTQKPLQYSL